MPRGQTHWLRLSTSTNPHALHTPLRISCCPLAALSQARSAGGAVLAGAGVEAAGAVLESGETSTSALLQRHPGQLAFGPGAHTPTHRHWAVELLLHCNNRIKVGRKHDVCVGAAESRTLGLDNHIRFAVVIGSRRRRSILVISGALGCLGLRRGSCSRLLLTFLFGFFLCFPFRFSLFCFERLLPFGCLLFDALGGRLFRSGAFLSLGFFLLGTLALLGFLFGALYLLGSFALFFEACFLFLLCFFCSGLLSCSFFNSCFFSGCLLSRSFLLSCSFSAAAFSAAAFFAAAAFLAAAFSCSISSPLQLF